MSGPPILVTIGLAIITAFLGTFLFCLAVSTDYWQVIQFQPEKLKRVPGYQNTSVLNVENGYYKLLVKNDNMPRTDDQNKTAENINIFYLRDSNGGIWRVCDRMSDSYRESVDEASPARKLGQCFTYIKDYPNWKAEMNNQGIWLVRMQNSAASSSIVSLMCLFVAAIMGIFGLTQRQVSACMVTGVMYVVAGVFSCFVLVIIHTRMNYMREGNCYSVEKWPQVSRTDVCQSRIVSSGWSIPLAWISFVLFLVAFILWLMVSRRLRVEKAKIMI